MVIKLFAAGTHDCIFGIHATGISRIHPNRIRRCPIAPPVVNRDDHIFI